MLRGMLARLLAGAVGLMLLLGVSACSKEEGLKIKRIEPKEGTHNGGDGVTIYGSGFQKGGAKSVDVYFGKKKARIRGFEGSTKLFVETPGGEVGEIVNVTLIFGDSRKLEIENAYKYVDATAGFGVDELTEGDEDTKKKKKKKKSP